MSTVFLVDGRDYAVDDAGTRWLTDHLLSWSSVDEDNRETWPEEADPYRIERAKQIAEMISEDVEEPEPVKLGWRDSELLLLVISSEYQISGNPGLEALYEAARRQLMRES